MNLWASEFGDDYTRRNSVMGKRGQVWKLLLPKRVESVLEVGANSGLNLHAIATLCGCDLYACEPNDLARTTLLEANLCEHITADYADKLSFPDEAADLVFTCGVLIHVPPDKLIASMREIHRCAKRYIICGEYFAPSEEMIPYRGYQDALWRRDYGSLWLDTFSDLYCIGTLFAWKRMTGLDNITFWVFEKGPRRN